MWTSGSTPSCWARPDFFFPAEDGIRDADVTGVQTCALPICDTLNRLTSLENGSATSIVTTGSGNAITSLTKSGSVITATKGLSFALASHTHTIAQITGLQAALDLKATPADITTAIDGIEIGGRNLLVGSKDYSLSNPIFAGSTGTVTGMDENFWVLTLGETYLQINIPSKIAVGERFTFSLI